MKLFSCQGCGNLLYFENIRCESCGRTLGYLPDLTEISALDPKEGGGWTALAAQGVPYRFCRNFEHGVCNWMLPADSHEEFCAGCRHYRTIPDLSVEGNAQLWGKIEIAKHRLFYSLLRLGLPLENRADDPDHGLVFDFLQDPPDSHAHGVMTGHDNGLITLAVREADDAVREKVRGEMGEPYRTLLGHFRHEIGHYFWDRLVASERGWLEAFRALFGDDRQDYGQALQKHYDEGAPADWADSFVSIYATTHPWEDFAETWAHYLHIVDTLEMASEFGMEVRPKGDRDGELTTRIRFNPYEANNNKTNNNTKQPFTFAMNSVNRAMGMRDLYPFILSPVGVDKLGVIHGLVRNVGKAGKP